MDAQNLSKELVLKGKDANDVIPGAQWIRYKSPSSTFAYLEFSDDQMLPESELQAFLSEYVFPNESFRLQSIRQSTDPLGFTHHFHQLYFQQYPVEGSWLITHSKGNKVLSMNGNLFIDIPEASTVSLSSAQALNNALEDFGAQSYMWENPAMEAFQSKLAAKFNINGTEKIKPSFRPEGEMVILPSLSEDNTYEYNLAYTFNIYAQIPHQRKKYFVDALTGDIIFKEDLIHEIDSLGKAKTKYIGLQDITTHFNGEHFTLEEKGKGGGIQTLNMQQSRDFELAVDFVDDDNFWDNENEAQDETAPDVQIAASRFYDFLLEKFDRKSIDDADMPLISNVHFGDQVFNAFWNGQTATFGDGSGNVGPLTSIDIVGHEFVHGLTDGSADLIYYTESGALNESFSDIFGEMLERFILGSNDWKLGQEIGRTIRDMSNPNSFGHPDTYFGRNWLLGERDNGGVHINSGVQNFWFYLLCEGGSGTNDNGDTYTVNPIGHDKATEIAYRTLSTYLSPISRYVDARFYSMLSAIDLFGACSPEVQTVINAWHAVGLGDAYTNQVIANFSVDPAFDCKAPFEVQFTNTSYNGATYTWDFGDGTTSNEVSPRHTYTAVGTYEVSLSTNSAGCGQDVRILPEAVKIGENIPCSQLITEGNSNACSGRLYDPGGPFEFYGDEEVHTMTIKNEDATQIRLAFDFFDYEYDFDYLYIYDGEDSNAPLIGRFTGDTLPNGGEIISSFSAITLVHTTDPGLRRGGFALNWSCIFPTEPPAADFIADSEIRFCGPTGTVNFENRSSNGVNWTWYFGDGSSSTELHPTHTYTEDGEYTVRLIARNQLGNDTLVVSKAVNITLFKAPEIEGLIACRGQEANLSAISPEGSVRWYDESGNLLNIGNQFSLDSLEATTNFFVEQEVIPPRFSAGPASWNFGSGSFHRNSSTQYLKFDILRPIVLERVFVNADQPGERTIILWDGFGNIIHQTTVDISSGERSIGLNWELEPGTDYRIGGSEMGLYRNNSGPSYPYLLDDLVEITGSSAGDDYYYYFYNWRVREQSCVSTRKEITVELAEDFADFSFNQEQNKVSFMDESNSSVKWTWDFGDGATSTSSNPVHNFNRTDAYKVKLIVENEAGCTDSVLQVVNLTGGLTSKAINLFPNPASKQLQVVYASTEELPTTLRLYDQTGRLVLQNDLGRTKVVDQRLDLSQLAAGIYNLLLSVGEQTASKKVLVRKK